MTSRNCRHRRRGRCAGAPGRGTAWLRLFQGDGGLARRQRPFASINGGPIKPAVYFGLQRCPGLAEQQPVIEGYSLRPAVARQIVVVLMSQRAQQIYRRCQCRFPRAREANAWIVELVCSSCAGLAMQMKCARVSEGD